MLNFVIDVGSSAKFVADVHIHSRLGSGEGPVKPLLQADSTPATAAHNNIKGRFSPENLLDRRLHRHEVFSYRKIRQILSLEASNWPKH
ncbi:MAG: hypothetical protein DMG93_16145 [Acidobacteria bacterium]|nr:MAG: hypothetical protein DMG93_16145 [Acidobacteriota bacterium]